MSALRRAAYSAALLTATAALSACGTIATPVAPEPVVSASPAAATGPKVGDTLALTALAADSGAAVVAKKTARMTMTVTGAQQGTYEADVDYRGAKSSVSMVVTQGGQTIDVRFVGGVMYIGSDSLAAQAGGKPWITIDPAGKDAVSKALGPFLAQMEASFVNPAEQLTGYDGVNAQVTAVEADRVTYTVALTAEQLRAAATQAAIPTLDETALAQLPNGVTYEMTVDAAMLPVSMSMEIAGQSMDVEYSDWGKPVTIVAPTRSEVGSIEEP
ncbi:MAG: hypothetical protein ACRCYX_02790 [Dermatophilaceae bacterium]